jgi:hypothetical protein
MVVDKYGNKTKVLVIDQNSTHKGIRVQDTYKIIYKNTRKPKRKVVEILKGGDLIVGMNRVENMFTSYAEAQKMKNVPLDEIKTNFRAQLRGLVETWGCQRMGLSTLLSIIDKNVKREIKSGKDSSWLSIVVGFYGMSLIDHISENSSNDSCRTITVVDTKFTDEEVEKFYPDSDDKETDPLKEEMKKYGAFGYEYS